MFHSIKIKKASIPLFITAILLTSFFFANIFVATKAEEISPIQPILPKIPARPIPPLLPAQLHYKCYNITEIESEAKLPANLTLFD